MRAVLALAVVLLACSGQAEGGASNVIVPPAAPAPAPVATSAAFACDPGAAAAPDELRRLTMTQYRNTVRDLTRWVLGDEASADAVMSMAGIDAVPIDRRESTLRDPHGSYRRLDQALDQSHVDETFRVATTLGTALAGTDHLGALAGACATDMDASNDEACVTDFVQRFGARALRHPLDADDAHFYRAVYGSDPTPDAAAYADVITVMLSSPEFLYLVEHGEAEVADDPGNFTLSAHELATRLSYHFWQTLPDDELWQAAEDDSLLDPAVLAQQVARMMDDPRTRATMAELFGDWLGLDALPALDEHAQDPLFVAFAGADLPGPDLRQHVIDDALDMLAYFTWTDPQGMDALLTSPLSFARGDDLARIYGSAAWDGESVPPMAGARTGLLTHAWFLVSGSANTRPIPRGVFVRRTLLCDDLAPPPATANAAVPPALRPDKTTRQVVEELTEQPGTVCVSCHATEINPLGFAFEGYDALGRTRVMQPLFQGDGSSLGALPVDTTSVPRVTPDDASASHGPADLVQLMLRSGKLEACFARNYFRFTFGRYEDPSRDGCALERLRARIAESGRIRDMIEEAGLLPELQQRRFEP
jgi:uncharacterized protein DUF1592/uncharacterized protein DUF1588/uncharacterized protein DUF1595/uncharacterized protein DUF1585